MFFLVLRGRIVTLDPQVFIFDVMRINDVTNNMVDKDSIVVEVITKVEMVSRFDRIYNCTMQGEPLSRKVGRLDLVLRPCNEIFREVYLYVLSIICQFHFGKCRRHIFYVRSVH